MSAAIIKAVLSLIPVLMAAIGKRQVSRFIAQLRREWDNYKDDQLKKMCDEEYNNLASQWDKFKDDRGDL